MSPDVAHELTQRELVPLGRPAVSPERPLWLVLFNPFVYGELRPCVPVRTTQECTQCSFGYVPEPETARIERIWYHFESSSY